MADKKLTILLHGADRELWQGDSSRLAVRQLYPQLRLLHSQRIRGRIVEVRLDLAFDAGQSYVVMIEAGGHRPAWRIVRHATFVQQEGGRALERPDAILRLMLVPTRPVALGLAEGYARVAAGGFPFHPGQDGDWYDALGPIAQMTFLNIEAKLQATAVAGLTLASHVRTLRHVAPDRVYLLVRPELKTLIESSADFAPASGHAAPPPPPTLPAHPRSWKHTRFLTGNIQLSFSRAAEPGPAPMERCYSVDADIDLESGVAHIVEWLDNNVLAGHKTGPTLIYKLLFDQGILPSYTLGQKVAARPRKDRAAPARRRAGRPRRAGGCGRSH